MRDDFFRTRGIRTVGIQQQRGILIGDEKAGRDRVDADAYLRKVNGEPLCEIGDRRLRAGIRRDPRQRAETVHAGNIDDRRAGLFRHIERENLRRDQRAEEIEIEHKLDARGIEIEKRLDALDRAAQILRLEIILCRRAAGIVPARAVEQNVAGAELLCDLLFRSLHRIAFEHIGGNADGISTVLTDLPCHLLRGIQSEIADRNARAACGQRLGKAGAKHASAPRDDRDLSLQIDFKRKFHLSPPFPHKNGKSFLFILLYK